MTDYNENVGAPDFRENGKIRPKYGSRGDEKMERRLTRREMTDVIEGRGCAFRMPTVLEPWITPGAFGDKCGEVQRIMDGYPCDAEVIHLRVPEVFNAPPEAPGYRWLPWENRFGPNVPLDAVSAIDDWSRLDEMLAAFPDPKTPCLIPPAPPKGETYRIAHWWYWLFERFWSLRGMENCLCDFYEEPECVHRLFRRLTDFYKVTVRRAKEELGADAIWTSDDIGMQTGPFFSTAIFREFFLPYYKELIDYTHSLGMHFWLHCCGSILPFLPDLIDAGLDVLHPIQKYTMDEREVAEKYGDRICIWAGFDVQRIIPYGTPEEVRQEVDFLIDTYARPEGRLILGAGNGMTPDTPIESIRALYGEIYARGREKCGEFLSRGKAETI